MKKKEAKVTFQDNMRPGEAEDFKFDFQTPPEVAKYMASLIPVECVTVLEPTPGIGNIKNALIDAGKDVTAPDNYWDLDKSLRFDATCMNPPFSKKFTFMKNAPDGLDAKGMKMGYWFLNDCLTHRSDIVIALMPWYTISDSDVRLRQFTRYGMRSVTALPRKTFQFARIQTVVIHFEKGYKGKTEFVAYDCLNDDLQHSLYED
jgi:type I restriction-modification system DNA methylase subunit